MNLRLNIAVFLLLILLGISTNMFSQELATSKQDTISVIAVGDIMMGTDFPRYALPSNNGKDLLKSVESTLKSADITLGNLEGVLLDGGKPAKKCRDTTSCYIFRTPTKYVSNLVNAGFDVMSLSNNHANDFGDGGRTSTKNTLTEAGIKFAGIKGEVTFVDVSDTKIGIIAFSTSTGCYSLLDIPQAESEVTQLRQNCDIVVVSFHGGAEGESAKYIPGKNEIMYGEDRGDVIKFAHAVIDAGADVVIGHGPHVPRALELYKNRLIAYSLGNFCTYKGFNISDSKGLAPILKVNFDSEGKFIDGKIISAKQTRWDGTSLDTNNKAAKLIAKLTKEDFPNSKLIIDNSGYFERKESK